MTSLAMMARSRSRDQKPQITRTICQTVVVSTRPRNRQQGMLSIGNLNIACALGTSGIGVSKREGDGKTPMAAMEVLFGFYRSDRWPLMSRAPWLLPVSDNLGWCDAPRDANYNRAIKRPYAMSHETLTRDDALYDCVIVLNWNITPRMRNRGSAIFLHLAKPGLQPTEGCIAVSKTNMMRLIRILKPKMHVKTKL